MVGFRDGVQVTEAANVLIVADCGEDDVTFGVRGDLLAEVAIDRLVIEGVNPWVFLVFGLTGRALLRYTVQYQIAPLLNHVRIRALDGLSARPRRTGGNTTLQLEVGVFDGAGNAVPNRTIELALTGIAGTGGHIHAPPTDPAALGELSETTVNTGPGGITTVVYQAGIASGERELRGTSADATDAAVTITVAVGGLMELLPGANYGLIGATSPHPANHFGAQQLVTDLQALAQQFFQQYAQRLEFNDMSLIAGGIFDLNRNYQGPHFEHRVGTNCDLRTITLNAAQRDFILRRWERLGGSVHDETESAQPHYHLRL